MAEARFNKAWKNADMKPKMATPVTAPQAAGVETSEKLARVTLKSGLSLAYREQGPRTGPAMIMLHGYSDSSFSFSPVLPLLPPTLRVIVPDQRGHGASDRARDGYSMDAMARDVVELMDALNVPTATIVGHSMGSFVARRLASLAPERVSRMVLVGAGPLADNDVVRELQPLVMALQDPVDREFVREFQYGTIARPVSDDFMARVIAESLTLDASSWKALMDGMLNYVPAEREITAPTLVLGGDQDSVFSVEEHQALGGRIRGARVSILPGIGHAPHWEAPDAFTAELLRFVGAGS
jgi:pimeloyl-ACP methyl ester carboxylesterase